MRLKTLIALMKYALALLLLALVLSQIDREALLLALLSVHPLWFLAAFTAFTYAQIMSVLRMHVYYNALQKPIPLGFSLRLHYVALFYNLMVPGGVGGDGYRVYVLKQHLGYAMKEGVKIQLATRLNGLLVILVSLLAGAAILAPKLVWPLLLMALSGAALYVVLIPRLFSFSGRLELSALPYSLAVQGGNLLAASCLLMGLNAADSLIAFLLLFQVAAIAGMLPITIGGLGLREFTFLYGAELLSGYITPPLISVTGVTLSLLFFVLTLLQAMLALPWLSRFGKISS